MHKAGKFLFVLGFMWVVISTLGAGMAARSLRIHHRAEVLEKQSYTREDLEVAFGEGANGVADFAKMGCFGGLLMLGGGIILIKSVERDSAIKNPN